MLNKIEILQQAYGLIGKYFNDINDLGPSGDWASKHYDLVVKSIIQNDYWPFANAQRELARLSETPLAGWQYAYQLPSDYLTANYVEDTLRYYIFEDKLYSDNDKVILNYRFMPSNSRFRANFTIYLVYRIATDLGLNSQVTEKYLSYLIQETEKLRISAASANSKEVPNRTFRSRPLDEVRSS